jgi:hypothetical protein
MQLHYSTALGVAPTSGALIMLLTGDRASGAARRCWSLFGAPGCS